MLQKKPSEIFVQPNSEELSYLKEESLTEVLGLKGQDSETNVLQFTTYYI